EATTAAAFDIPQFDQRTMEEIAEEATRFHPATFSDVLVEQLRATPYFALSAMIHICLAIILNFLTTPVQEPQETPPFEAGFEHRDVQTPDEIEVDGPSDPDPEIEEEIDPVDAAEPQDVILPNDPFDMDVPDTAAGSLEGPPLDTFSSGLAGGGLGSGLSGVGGINGGGKSFRRYVRSLRTSGLDIVVVIDSTGSMENVIQQARTQISRMITTVGGLVPNFRLGVVTYRDRGDEYLTRQLPLTPNYYEAVDFLDGLQADGGGDIPEAVLDGMKKAVRDMSWAGKAKRIVVLVGDAQPHARDMDSLRGLAADFTRKNGTVHTLATVADSFGNRRADPAAIRAFRAISKAGRGVSATLEDSGAVVRQIIEIAFGAEHKSDIGEAISRAETGWRNRRYKRMVEAKDLKGLLAAMLRKPAPQALFRECLLANEAALLPVYLEALGHAHATLQTRWAATVLVKRLVRRNRDRRVRETARSLTPEGPLSRVKRRVTEFRQAARAAGLPTVMPND
ncbi:MAG: vWA domain-containing protein, partial [Planctomycetota bacterium]|nr:vWA domain-containing protein [Planctomycetota bacterium]